MASHRLTPHPVKTKRLAARARLAADPAEPSWPSFPGGAQYVGASASGRVAVWVDPALGAPGQQNALDLVGDGDRVLVANDALFGVTGGGVQVLVYALGGQTDGTGGADHMACDFISGGSIEVCASFGASIRCSALLEAEVSECAMGGNLCGLSTGEALSRWAASSVSGNALPDFATAPTWAADGMANWVDQTDPTDQNPDSTGCGMAFLSWLQSMGYALPRIAQCLVAIGDGATLAELYGELTRDDPAQAWTKFSAAAGALSGIASDDPFAGGAPALTLDQVQSLLAAVWPVS
jgi:hypothetical protein